MFLQLLLTLLTAGSVVSIVLLERDKLGKRIVWSTFIVQGVLLYILKSSLLIVEFSNLGVSETKSLNFMEFMNESHFSDIIILQ